MSLTLARAGRRLSAVLLAALALAGCAGAGSGALAPAGAASSTAAGAGSGTATGAGSSTAAGAGSGTAAPAAVDPGSGLAWVAESALPVQARRTLALIRSGGPYPYPRNDDQTFGNREGVLPAEPSGYYREYTVATPGEDDRGPRRIVAGRGGERYYTEDHYQSFRRVKEGL